MSSSVSESKSNVTIPKTKLTRKRNNSDADDKCKLATLEDENDKVDIKSGIEDETGADGNPANSSVRGFSIVKAHRPQKMRKVQRVLPRWLSQPTVISGNVSHDRTRVEKFVDHLDDETIKLLKENGIEEFFPVQTQVIHDLLTNSSVSIGYQFLFGKAGFRPRDICCSAPTGSGKTLSFVVPIVQILKHRVIRAVRCLVVVPVGDLAEQVYKVFCQYCKRSSLRVGLITGVNTFEKEQASLVKEGPYGFRSQVDVVVCTPGRLVDHINTTKGFNLTNLRFLVIDEADRMMEEIKQNWLAHVEKAVYKAEFTETDRAEDESSSSNRINLYSCLRKIPGPLTARSCSRSEIPLQKLLFSATLSHNPEKLEQLKLYHPKLITSASASKLPVSSTTVDNVSTVQQQQQQTIKTGQQQLQLKNATKEQPNTRNAADDVTGNSSAVNIDGDSLVKKYETPAGLTEKFVECTKSEKSLLLLYLMKELNFKQVLCFTNSVEATHRLCELLKLVGGVEMAVQEISSKLYISKRSRILRQFASGKINVLVCSDAMARGMDIENVECVILYDVPSILKRYVHRVGRTARAGRTGTAITLLEKKEIFHFKKMLNKAGMVGIKELKIKRTDLKPFVEPVKKALNRLPNVLKTEKKMSGNQRPKALKQKKFTNN